MPVFLFESYQLKARKEGGVFGCNPFFLHIITSFQLIPSMIEYFLVIKCSRRGRSDEFYAFTCPYRI